MRKNLYICLALGTMGLGSAPAAQAQVSQAIMLGTAIFRGAHQASNSPEAPVVTTAYYRTHNYLMQRTPPAGRGILGGDQIGYLERQLDQCRARLQADSTGHVCTAAQLSQLQATRTAILAVQPKWPVQLYDQEIAFYTAEDTRRQPAAAPAK